MPYPGILARICDRPCESVCRRAEAGGAIAISDVEKIAVTLGRVKKRRPAVPPKDARVAIAGRTLSGLAAAWDLAHKGYRVTIFGGADRVDGSLLRIPEKTLPLQVAEQELAVLYELAVETRPIDEAGKLLDTLAGFDAVYVTSDPGSPFSKIGEYISDPLTLATSRPGLFANVENTEGQNISTIFSVAQRRRAAGSIDRFLQKVSLTAGREREGPYETRLVTNLGDIEPCPRIPMVYPSGYGETEAREEAGRCTHCECMECVKVCLYLEHFKSYPKRYIREIYNNETILIGSHGHTNKLINSCSLCGLCAAVCPNNVSRPMFAWKAGEALSAGARCPLRP